MIRFPKQNIKNVRKGDLLISEPLLPDDNFSRTVILICDDTSDAHLGFVINKVNEELNLGEVVDDFSAYKRDIFLGGPVQQEIVQVLHKYPVVEDAISIGDGIYWGGDFDQIRDGILNGIFSVDDFWFYMGYSGWHSGQVLKEIKEKSWLVLRHDLQDVLGMEAEEIWENCIRLLGKEFDFMTKFPIDPRLN